MGAYLAYMKLIVKKSKLSGAVEIPGSKSHTIRAVAIASLAKGKSVIKKPLSALDTLASVDAYRLLGAHVDIADEWVVEGISGLPVIPENVIDVGNSGTTLYIAMGSSALVNGVSVFTGDEQIRRRPAQPLIDALNQLGAKVESTRGNGMAPITIKGPIRGGFVRLNCSKTSQYLTSLLVNCPLAGGDTEIEAVDLVEKPYIQMTLSWLLEQGVKVEHEDFRKFFISGNQNYKPGTLEPGQQKRTTPSNARTVFTNGYQH